MNSYQRPVLEAGFGLFLVGVVGIIIASSPEMRWASLGAQVLGAVIVIVMLIKTARKT